MMRFSVCEMGSSLTKERANFACQFFVLKGGEDYGYDEKAEEEAAAVGDRVDDGVFVELAT